MHVPIVEKEHPLVTELNKSTADLQGHGVKKIYRFENNYGASVVRFMLYGGIGSYGAESGLWELALIEFKDEDNTNYELKYPDIIVGGDVLGGLTEEEVESTLAKIQQLNPGELDAENLQ